MCPSENDLQITAEAELSPLFDHDPAPSLPPVDPFEEKNCEISFRVVFSRVLIFAGDIVPIVTRRSMTI